MMCLISTMSAAYNAVSIALPDDDTELSGCQVSETAYRQT